MIIDIILICTIVALVGAIIFQQTKVVVARRNEYQLRRNIKKERGATADILTLSRDVVTKTSNEEEFLSHFVEYALRALKGVGAAVLTCDKNGTFTGCAVAGTFPSLKEVTPQVEQQLMAHAKKHTEFIKGIDIPFNAQTLDIWCNSTKFAYFKDKTPRYFPERFIREAHRMLMAPVKIRGETQACVIVTSNDDFDSYTLETIDGEFLVRLVELASLSLEVLKVFTERQEYEEQLQYAKEEGMIQVSTGIIHNIGNAITVAKLSILELKEKMGLPRNERPEFLILQELLPAMRAKLKEGSIDSFLSKDPAGIQYLDIIDELLNHTLENNEISAKQLNSLSGKLYHISEIIELQQRFVGELGTENLTHLSTVIDSSIKIFEETFNKRGVAIATAMAADTPEVLIDPSMMTQVLMNLIKNAVEAMDAENSSEKSYSLKIELYSETREDEEEKKTFAVIAVTDNGPGMPDSIRERVFDFGFSTKSKGNIRGYGLHSCNDTIQKYGGLLEVESEIDVGTTFKISLPVGKQMTQ